MNCRGLLFGGLIAGGLLCGYLFKRLGDDVGDRARSLWVIGSMTFI
jgi:hypothetical protein